MKHISGLERYGTIMGWKKGYKEGWDEKWTVGRKIGLSHGRIEGYDEGHEKGRRDGQISLILRVFKRRWGTLAQRLETRLSKLSIEQLDEWGDTILEFRDSTALQQWLDKTKAENLNAKAEI